MFKVIRKVTMEECPWLDRDIEEGEIVEEYDGCTYGCITYKGVAVMIEGIEGFSELPINALEKCK